MATKKELEKAEVEQVESVEPVQSDGAAGGTVSTEPQPRQELGKETVLIVPQGDKPPQEQPTLDEAPPDPDEVVLFRNDTNAPVLLGETYLFPANSRKAPRSDGAGKGLTEL